MTSRSPARELEVAFKGELTMNAINFIAIEAYAKGEEEPAPSNGCSKAAASTSASSFGMFSESFGSIGADDWQQISLALSPLQRGMTRIFPILPRKNCWQRNVPNVSCVVLTVLFVSHDILFKSG
jgi:hypothetical protein